MVLHHRAGDLGAGLEGQLDGEAPRQVVRLRILRHGFVINVPRIEVFPPDPVTALTQVPGHDAVAILLERVQRHEAAFPDPVDIVAEADRGGFGVVEIVVELPRVVGHRRHVIVHAQLHAERVQALAQFIERGRLRL